MGLPQAVVKESTERVRLAISNSGYSVPGHAVLINLAPADVKKEGPSLDLPIAIGLPRATNFIAGDRHRQFLIAGELALDGRLLRAAIASLRCSHPECGASSKQWTEKSLGIQKTRITACDFESLLLEVGFDPFPAAQKRKFRFQVSRSAFSANE